MADGKIRIDIEVDGKQITLTSNQLDKLEDSALQTGKGLKSAENGLDSLSDSGAKASTTLNSTGGAIDGLGDSGAQASKDIKGTEGSIDALADSSADASSNINGVSSSLDGMADNATDAAQSTRQASNEAAGMGEETSKASDNTKAFAISLGLVAIGAAAFSVLRASMDDAISRFDTLNQFPKVLGALGVSADEADAAMSNLSDGIDGLPTKLDDIAASAQEMYMISGDIDHATESAVALNNVLLGSGATSEQAKRGLDQYTKALQLGEFNMVQWNTMSETMSLGLVKIGEEFGFAAKTAKTDLYQALQDGTITMDEFNAKLIEVGTGTGIMATLAKENSLGIATSWGNLRIAAARGVAGMIDSFNELSKEVTGKDIAENIDSLKVIVNQAFKFISSSIESATPFVIAFANGVKATTPVVKTLTPAIIGLMSAYGAYLIISKATAAVQASNRVLAIAQASQKAVTFATNAQIASKAAEIAIENAVTAAKAKGVVLTQAQIAVIAKKAIADKAAMAASAAELGLIRSKSIAIGILTGQMSISAGIMAIKTAASYALGTAIRFLLGPVGLIITGIGLLVSATIAIVKWFKRTSEEAERLKEENEELASATESLTESVNSSADAYQDNQREIRASAKGNEDLANKVEELANKENKSAAEKLLLNDYIQRLNGSIDGLNLSYDEEANALNMSSKELEARLVLMKETEAGIAAQERLSEIVKEQASVEEQLAAVIAQRIEVEESSTLSKGDAKEQSEKLIEQEDKLRETLAILTEQYGITEEQIVAASQNAAAAVEEGNLRQITSYEELEGAHKETFDKMMSSYDSLVDHATNAFDRMNDESKATAEEMIANLEHNQKMTEEWGKNVATLYDRAGKEGNEGFIQWLESMGPESAAELAVVSDMSDKELERFIELMNEGGTVASQSLKDSLGDGFDEVVDVMTNFVNDGSKSLRDQIKAADFESIGIAIPEGLEAGFKEGAPKVERASADMARNVDDAFKEHMAIRSPSRVFRGHGTDITEGLTLGISSGTMKVIRAMQQLAKTSIQQFRTTPIDFRSIGQNAMAGLNQGLLNGRARVLNTARSIANSVASTMQSALRIHSPSRVMRDDVGRFIPEGIALGIEENAGKVYKVMQQLSEGMVLTSSPEVALGTSRMAYSTSGNQIAEKAERAATTAISSGQSTGKQPAIINVYVGAKKVASEIVDDITQLQNRKTNRQQKFRPRGV